MKYTIQFIFLILISAAFPTDIKAQTPTDALMMQKGQVCFAAVYSQDKWDEYWEGTLKRSNGNIGTLTRQTIMPMFTIGLIDRVNLIAALPWVHSEASGGQLKGASGFQDFGLWLKVRALRADAGPGFVSLHTALGFSLPTSDYLEDYAPFSIGLGCPDLSLRGTLQYRLNMGLYVRGQAAYLARGNAKIERDFYYTTHGVYSDEVAVPNALSYGGTLGIWTLNNMLNIETTFEALNTLGGHDIRRQDVGFPSNNMEFTRIGASFHYILPFIKGFGVVGQYSQVLTGRNVGQSTMISGGLTYQFGVWNRTMSPTLFN